ncbi:MAG: hypothetical protein AMJ56_00345 [Anaerolineae bacterium SG8_19]|nr:MAG: hypothetical protein AMJ56_00345 [Anaerolineae bacterium SG8_19]
MATTTFTGPIKAGDVLNTTGSTVGTLKNVGTVVTAQQAAVAQSATAASTTIVIPANSTIVSIDLFVTTAWSSATTTYTVSVGTSATATELVAATNANAIGRLALTPGTDATKTGLWVNVGTSDVQIYVKSGAPDTTPGAGTLVVRYIQAANA